MLIGEEGGNFVLIGVDGPEYAIFGSEYPILIVDSPSSEGVEDAGHWPPFWHVQLGIPQPHVQSPWAVDSDAAIRHNIIAATSIKRNLFPPYFSIFSVNPPFIKINTLRC